MTVSRDEAVAVVTARGTLRGIRHLAAGERRAVAVLLQGYFSCTHVGPVRLYVEIGRLLASMGVEMWRVSPIGCGDSDGDFDGTGYDDELADHTATLQAVQRAGKQIPLWLIGHSLGAHYALRIAADDAAVARNIVISPAFGPFRHLANMFNDAQRADLRERGETVRKGVFIRDDFVGAMEADVIEIAKRVRQPTTFIYGTRDEFYPRTAIEPFVAAMPDAGLITIDGGDHNYMTPDVRESMLGKLAQHVKESLPAPSM